MIAIKDKTYGNVSIYEEIGCGLHIDTELIQHNGIIENARISNWELCIGENLTKGYGIDELYNKFIELINDFDLKNESVKKKHILVIYIDNLNWIRGFFKDTITEDFTYYVQVMYYLEFRPTSIWKKDLHNAEEIAYYAQYLISNIFVPEKYFYITPNQQLRRKLRKAMQAEKDTTIEKININSWSDYKIMRNALFGGLCYCPYPNLVIEKSIMELDLNSAYIFDLLVEKHCMSKAKIVDPNHWEYYLEEDNNVTSFGRYKIKYACTTNKAHCYKNYKGFNVEYGEHEDIFYFNDIDLKIFMSLVTVLNIECKYLEEYELDYIPKFMRDCLVTEYIKKNSLKNSNDKLAYKLQKTVINGAYGDTIRKYTTIEEFKNSKKKATTIPQWGIWTTSYCKKHLLALATKIDGWYYSDTDSIYCKDTPKNRKLLKEFNDNIRLRIKEFCDEFGYNYDNLKDLGTFEIKNTITKFKAIKQKEYMFTDTKGIITLKAAGCNREKDQVFTDDIYDLEKIPVGKKTFGFFTDDGYYELTYENEEAELMTYIALASGLILDN